MLYKNWKLSHFFICVLFLFGGLLWFVLYGWRTNSQANLNEENGLDISSPYYDKEKTKTQEEYPAHEDPHAAPKGGEPDAGHHDNPEGHH